MLQLTIHKKGGSLWLQTTILNMTKILKNSSFPFTRMAKFSHSSSRNMVSHNLLLGKWVKQYSTVEMDDGNVLTAKQVKELQKRNAQLEEENLILKKRLTSSRHTLTTISRCT